mmetsp:Transcript_59070/g.109152  ORF Transcript_59070/g.109152 Transcript_59070/m.109152 type:complete len:274 (-) Transcript_59070:172-993(-)
MCSQKGEWLQNIVQNNSLNWGLQNAPEELRRDQEVVLAAVVRDGHALEYAAEELKRDRLVVLAAVVQDANALRYAGEALKSDHQIVLMAVTQDGDTLEYASADLRNDRKIVSTAVRGSGQALEFAGEELKRDQDIVLMAVAQDPISLHHAADSLLWDESFAVEARMRHYFFKITALSGQSCIAAVEFLYGPGILRQCCSKLLGWESTGSEVFVHDSEMVTPSSLSADSPGGPARGKLVEYQLIRLSPPEGSASTSRSVQNPKGRLELMARAAH